MKPKTRSMAALVGVLSLLAAAAFSCAAAAVAETAPAAAPPDTGNTFEIISAAKAKVFPAVVFIKPIVEKYQRGEKQTQEVSGSGVLISPDGEVVTNYHVVEKAVSIRCLLYDGRHYDAKVVGTDKETDLALLQLETKSDSAPLAHAFFGDSSLLREGDFVMAMGAPYGLNRSVSLGIVSCTHRYIPRMSQYSLWLQTDAALNPGNSGGPLVNTSGEVVGVNTLAVSSGGDLGFAIPSQTVKVLLGQLREKGKIERAWTGLRLQPLKDFGQNIYFDADEGVIIAGADPTSPAARAGLTAGDRITAIQGRAVTALTDVDLPAVRSILALLPTEEEALLEVYRNGTRMQIALVPRIKGKVEGEELDCPRWNMTVKTINEFDNPDLFFVRKEGVFIFGTKYPGNAASSGLRPNDIITRIDGKAVTTLEDAKAAYDEVTTAEGKRTRIVLEIIRGGITRQAVLDFSKEYKSD